MDRRNRSGSAVSMRNFDTGGLKRLRSVNRIRLENSRRVDALLQGMLALRFRCRRETVNSTKSMLDSVDTCNYTTSRKHLELSIKLSFLF